MKKLNKKGFTLVELLAVIVVIALVLGLVTYSVINVYNSAKTNSYAVNEKSILEAARIYAGEPEAIWNTDSDDKEYFCTSVQQLKNKGLLKKEIKTDKIETTAYIIVEKAKNTGVIENSRILTGKNEAEVSLIDNVCSFKRYIINYYESRGQAKKPIYTDSFEKFNTGNSSYTIKHTLDNKDNMEFVGWREGEDLDSFLYKEGNSFEITKNTDFYGQWELINNVTIKFYTEDGTVIGNNWSVQSGRNLHTINYNNKPYTIKKRYNSSDIKLALDDFNITRSGYEIDTNKYWKCESGCKEPNREYNITSDYNTNAFCDASSSSCEVSLKINWLKNSSTPRPNITASDNIPTGEQHPTDDYTIEITSDDDSEIYYYEEDGVKDCQSYSDDLYKKKYTTLITPPSNNITTYCAIAIKNGTPSEPEKYVSVPSVKLETLLVNRNTGDIAPNQYYTTNSSSANDLTWFNKDTFSPAIVYIITDYAAGNTSSTLYWNEEGKKTYDENKLTDGTFNGTVYNSEYYNNNKSSYLSKVFKSYPVSDNKYIFIKAINSDGARYIKFEYKNVSSNIYFRYDNTPPKIYFAGKYDMDGNQYTTNDHYQIEGYDVSNIKWKSYIPVLKWKATDTLSGVSTESVLHSNKENQSSLSKTMIYHTNVNGDIDGNYVYFTKQILTGGYRYLKLEVKDAAGNSATHAGVYFKYGTERICTFTNNGNKSSNSTTGSCIAYGDTTNCGIKFPTISQVNNYTIKGWISLNNPTATPLNGDVTYSIGTDNCRYKASYESNNPTYHCYYCHSNYNQYQWSSSKPNGCRLIDYITSQSECTEPPETTTPPEETGGNTGSTTQTCVKYKLCSSSSCSPSSTDASCTGATFKCSGGNKQWTKTVSTCKNSYSSSDCGTYNGTGATNAYDVSYTYKCRIPACGCEKYN